MTPTDFFNVLVAGFGVMAVFAVFAWGLEEITRNE